MIAASMRKTMIAMGARGAMGGAAMAVMSAIISLILCVLLIAEVVHAVIGCANSYILYHGSIDVFKLSTTDIQS